MEREGYDRKLLEKLELDIENFDKIVLIWKPGEEARRWLEALCESWAVRHTNRRILVWYVENLSMSAGDELDGQGMSKHDSAGTENGCSLDFSFEKISFQSVTETEAKELCHLHHMYEFSDRFLTIPETDTYGGLFNFVDTGLLQMDEVWEALLH